MIYYNDNGPRLEQRSRVKRYLAKVKKKGYVVADLGGGGDKWCDEFVDYYVDIFAYGSVNFIQGDLLESDTWKKISRKRPNFVICTHVLEDIRDPGFVIGEINKLNISGFISVPNKHTELSLGIESRDYPGYAHHRYMFSVVEGKLLGLAKYPLYAEMAKRREFGIDKELVSRDFELGLMFDGRIPFDYVNHDFCGMNRGEMKEIVTNFVKMGI